MDDETSPPDLAALAPQLLQAVIAQHEAIDRLFGMLIAKTMYSEKPFYPSESGQPWEAAKFGKETMDAAGVSGSTRVALPLGSDAT